MTSPTYIDRPKNCQVRLTPLIDPTSPTVRILPAGWSEQCPSCRRTWTVVYQIRWGDIVQPVWFCTSPPPAAGAAAQPSFLDRLTAVEARAPQEERALPQIGALVALGGRTDLTVTWPTAFPDASYRIEAVVPAALLGKATAVPLSQTATGAVIRVSATTAVVALGTVIDVTALRYA